jgi:hypothetical protein
LLVLSAAMVSTLASGAASAQGPGDASAPIPVSRIFDGEPVPACGWPSVVHLRTSGQNSERCTGVYIGGKIILTAAHCMDDDYILSVEDLGGACDGDGDCPNEDAFGDPLSLTCEGGQCKEENHPLGLRTNSIPAAKFGEIYPNGDDGHPRRSVPIKYCRQQAPEPNKSAVTDFAYCVLSEEPNVQPVPILMHCEVEATLTAGTEVIAVGVGWGFANPDSAGVKRFATAALPDNISSGKSTITVVGPWTNGQPLSGDSGGPLLVRMDDDTYRVVGVAANEAPTYVSAWLKLEWMLEDPNVQSDLAKILPCHTPQGQWQPTAQCGGFPLTPDQPHGDWARGPIACQNTSVSGLSETCGPPFQPLTSTPFPEDVRQAEDGEPSAEQDARRGLGLGLPLGLGLVGLGVWSVRRRGRHE